MNVNKTKIAALIVTYHPEFAKIQHLIQLILPQVNHTFILDNGAPSDFQQSFLMHENLTYLPMRCNLGIGSALNIGIENAVQIGCSHVITFDQDSAPAPDMVDRLIAAMNQLQADGHNVAAVGPSFVDHRQTPPMRYPFYRGSGWRIEIIHCGDGPANTAEADLLITSGCLYPIAIFKKIKPFDEGLFIDFVDTDWCFYARSLGFSLFGVCDATMSHDLGHGESRKFFGIRLIEYSPLRRYYYFRNAINFIKLSYVSWPWRFRLTIGMFLRATLLPVSPGDQKWAQLYMMTKGMFHGLMGISGPLIERR